MSAVWAIDEYELMTDEVIHPHDGPADPMVEAHSDGIADIHAQLSSSAESERSTTLSILDRS